MIDHVALYVTDIDRSRRFYEQALEAVGYTVAMERESFVGFRQEGGPMFAVRSGKEATATAHIAFQVRDRATVDAFHAAAVGAGGTDEGPPGDRAGGTVEKFIGDAVMAAFGAPAAQEDHTERALHAALAMQRRLAESFAGELALRIGVNTGEVVVGPPRERSSFVSGDAVNVGA